MVGTATVAPGTSGAAEAACPGRFLLGHGGDALPETAKDTVFESLKKGRGWRAAFRNDGPAPVEITAFASCVFP